ncbi:hypothetical protein [Bradyrhizobium sp. 145]|uniref:hypothetical protein n=1 Tax=Bradyrhizobium sp. 145 TaxID=2782621 RepID=UPI001FFA34CF|nr:hypothetical protein [Bradyrhizobium sp. 145]MCK1685629.1 hypothetical protein [Bradyrhizobium sp. 145]
MSGSTIYDQPSDAMMANARNWLELALHDDREFQKRLGAARMAETISFEDAMTLAKAALMVADAGPLQTFGPWYRESATLLFCRAYDAVALEREARAAAQAGVVQ